MFPSSEHHGLNIDGQDEQDEDRQMQRGECAAAFDTTSRAGLVLTGASDEDRLTRSDRYRSP
jgi:hypothetical protein